MIGLGDLQLLLQLQDLLSLLADLLILDLVGTQISLLLLFNLAGKLADVLLILLAEVLDLLTVVFLQPFQMRTVKVYRHGVGLPSRYRGIVLHFEVLNVLPKLLNLNILQLNLLLKNSFALASARERALIVRLAFFERLFKLLTLRKQRLYLLLILGF